MRETARVDLLTEELRDLGMTGVFYAASELSAPWGIAMPPLPGTMVFHLVTRGSAVIEAGDARQEVRAGDVVLVPRGEGHLILDAAGSAAVPLFDLPREEVGERFERIRAGGGGSATDLVCGAVAFRGLAARRLVAGLPPVLVVGQREDPEADWLRAALAVIGAESRDPRPGSDVVTARLSDVLVVRAVRAWLDSPGADRGWVAAVRDPDLGRSLSAFHEHPAEAWTVDLLARAAGMSRSAYAARFTALVGEPAMAYVTSWRMDLAARLVREERLPLARVAERVGYRSEASFNRAFRRAHGCTPGVFARRGERFLDLVDVP